MSNTRSAIQALEKILTCPITNKFIQHPVQSGCCGQLFEKSAVEETIQTGHAGCPNLDCGKELRLIPCGVLSNILKLLEFPESNLELRLTNLTSADLEALSKELECPVTGCLFHLPFTVSQCGHVFEREAIVKHFKKTQNNCPCCRAEMGNKFLTDQGFYQIPSGQIQIKNSFVTSLSEGNDIVYHTPLVRIIDALIRLHPELISRQYISTTIILDITADDLPRPWQWLTTYLCQNPDTLNQPLQDEPLDEANNLQYQHVSPLFILNITPQPLNPLVGESDELRKHISVAGLNTATQTGVYKGVSPLLVLSADLIELLQSDPVLRGKITSQGLVNVSESASYCLGMTPLLLLLGQPEGRALFLNDADLRSKITAEGLLLMCQQGENTGERPINFLLPHEQHRRELLTLLVNENEQLKKMLRERITLESQEKNDLVELLTGPAKAFGFK